MSAAEEPARTVFFGSGAFGVPILDALLAAPEVDVVGVVSVPDRPSGRRGASRPTPVAARARELGIDVLQPARIRDQAAIAEIEALRPTLGVLADYGRIVPGAVLHIPARGILNVHPSLLPRHRGAAPIPATILAGDPTTGVTLIQMDEGLDTGPIVAAVAWPLAGDEIASELETRAAGEGAALIRRSLAGWLAGTLAPSAQDERAATLTRPLRREDGRLDPARPARELERRVRAYQPWPGSFLETVAGPLKVWRAAMVPPHPTGDERLPVGRFGRGPDLRLGTADGELALLEVQPAGGRRMTGAELILGRPALPGSEVVVPAQS